TDPVAGNQGNSFHVGKIGLLDDYASGARVADTRNYVGASGQTLQTDDPGGSPGNQRWTTTLAGGIEGLIGRVVWGSYEERVGSGVAGGKADDVAGTNGNRRRTEIAGATREFYVAQFYACWQRDGVVTDGECAVATADSLFGFVTGTTQKKNAGARDDSARRRSN